MSNELLKREKILEAADKLTAAVSTAKTKLSDIDHDLGALTFELSAEGSSALLEARRVVKAAELRIDQLTESLQDGSPEALARGRELARSPLTLPTDPVNALITEPAGTEVPARFVFERLDKLFRVISTTGRKRTARRTGF